MTQNELVPRSTAPAYPKSILLLVASNRRRGAEVFGERLATGLGQSGWQVDFVALHSVTSDRAITATPLTHGETHSRLDVRTVLALRRRMLENQPSVVLANGGATLRYAVAARSTLISRPLLAYVSIGEPRYWLRSARHASVQRFLHRRAHVILAVSKMTRHQLVDDLGVAADRVVVAYTGVAPEYFVANEPSSGVLRLLFLGSLSSEKDPETAIDVALHLHQNHQVRLRIVGDGPLASDLVRRVETQEAIDIIEFTGSVDDVTPHLAWADILILTSRTEGLPGAVLEAGAAEVPTVAFDVGGTAETMEPGSSGVLVAPGDTAEMVAAVDRLARNPQERERMGEAARQFVTQHFTLDRSISRYDTILSELLAARNRR